MPSQRDRWLHKNTNWPHPQMKLNGTVQNECLYAFHSTVEPRHLHSGPYAYSHICINLCLEHCCLEPGRRGTISKDCRRKAIFVRTSQGIKRLYSRSQVQWHSYAPKLLRTPCMFIIKNIACVAVQHVFFLILVGKPILKCGSCLCLTWCYAHMFKWDAVK